MTKPKDKRVIYKLWYTGKPAYLHCCTSGNPSPTVKWFKDGHKIDFTDFRFNLKSSNQTLSIIPLRLADYGMYTCQSINRFGNESRTFKVDVKCKWVDSKSQMTCIHSFTCLFPAQSFFYLFVHLLLIQDPIFTLSLLSSYSS